MILSLALAALAPFSLQLGSTPAVRRGEPAQPAPQDGQRGVAEPTVLWIHDVRDLVWQARPSDFHAGVATIDSLTPAEQGEAQPTLLAASEHLAGIVRGYAAEPKPEIQVPSFQSFVVRAPSSTQEWITSFLECQRQGATTLVDVQARLDEAPLGTAQALGFGSSSLLLDSETAVKDLLQHLDARPGVEIVNRPRLIVRPLQQGSIAVSEQIAYVKNYELRIVEPRAVEIADPVIETLQEGHKLDVLPALLPDGRVGLEITLTQAYVERPIATREVTLAAHLAPVTVGVPVVTTATIKARVTLAPGAALCLTAIRPGSSRELPGEPDREVLVVITAQPVHADQLQR